MDTPDDELERFAARGALPLPPADGTGFVENEGARIFYAAYGSGVPVILLHGGLGHSGNFGFQLPAIRSLGRQAVLIDSRGHGRSTRDAQPYTYELLARDVRAVMRHLKLDRADLVGWSDGACTALTLAMCDPPLVASVFFFACNMDPSGILPQVVPSVPLGRCFARHVHDYGALSPTPTPTQFQSFAAAVEQMMKTQPNASADDLKKIHARVTIVQAEQDEFIRREHAGYLAATIPGARLVLLPGVSHFAPLQRPSLFNAALTAFLSAAG